MSHPSTPIETRFWPRVDASGDCWLWTGARDGGGYGNVWAGGSIRKAHIVSYELLVGPVSADLELDHLCLVPRCVNPAHLQPVTHAENMRRSWVARRHRTKTHCPAGHPYDEANTRRSGGSRVCRLCDMLRARARRAERLVA